MFALQIFIHLILPDLPDKNQANQAYQENLRSIFIHHFTAFSAGCGAPRPW
jgi:hypothetical protein